MRGNDRHIDVSIGYSIIIESLSRYSILRMHFSDKMNARCHTFTDYLIEGLRTLDFAAFLKEPDYNPWNFCGLGDLVLDVNAVDGLFQSIHQPFSISAFAIILGHEYVHHLLEHLPDKSASPTDRRKIEHIADMGASYLLGEKASRLPAAALMDVLSGFRSSDPFRIDRSHAAEECRFLFFLYHDRSFGIGFSDTELKKLFKLYPHIRQAFKKHEKALNVDVSKVPNCAVMLMPERELFQ